MELLENWFCVIELQYTMWNHSFISQERENRHKKNQLYFQYNSQKKHTSWFSIDLNIKVNFMGNLL